MGFVTVTGVELTNDLRHAKVFVSVMGSEAEKAALMNQDPRTSCLRASESGNDPEQTRHVSYSGLRRENRKLQWLAPPASVCVRSRRMPRVA